MSNANLGTLNVLSGVSTRVGLPLDYIIPIIEKMDAKALYNKQKVAEARIGLMNMPTISDFDKEEVASVNNEITGTISQIDQDDNWMAATGQIIKLAEKLSTDDRIKSLNTRVANYQVGEKELAENKEIPPTYKNVIREINQQAYQNLRQEDGTIGRFNYFQFNSNLDLAPFKDKVNERAKDIKASVDSYFDIIQTGHTSQYALDVLDQSNPQLSQLVRTELLKSGSRESITEEKLESMARTLMMEDPEFNATITDIISAEHFKKYKTLDVSKEHLIKSIADTASPSVQTYLLYSSDSYKQAQEVLNNKQNELYNAAQIYNADQTASNKAKYDAAVKDIESFSKTMEANKKLYLEEGSAKINEVTSDSDVAQHYYSLNSIPLKTSVFKSANHMAYQKDTATFKELNENIKMIGLQNASKAQDDLLNAKIGFTNSSDTGQWSQEDLFNPKGEFMKNITNLRNLKIAGAIGEDESRMLEDMESKLQANADMVLSNSHLINPRDVDLNTSFRYSNVGKLNVSLKELIGMSDEAISEMVKANYDDVKVAKDLKESKKDMAASTRYSATANKVTSDGMIKFLIKNRNEAISKSTRELNKDVSKIAIPMTNINVTIYNDSQNMAIQNDVLTTLMSGTAFDMAGKVIDNNYLKERNISVSTDKQLPMGTQISFINPNGAQGVSANETIVKVVSPRRDESGNIVQGQYSTIYMKYDGTAKGAILSNLSKMANISHQKAQKDATMRHAAATVGADVSSYIGGVMKLDVNGRKVDSWQFINELKVLHDKKNVNRSNPISFKIDDNTTGVLKRHGDTHYSLNMNYGGIDYDLQVTSLNSIPVILGALTGESYGLSKEVRKSIISKFIKE